MSEADPGSRPFIVVGVDGSPNSKAALRWAIGEAGVRGYELHAVTAYGHLMPGFGYMPVNSEQQAKEAQQLLDHTIEDVVGSEVPLPIHTKVVSGHPTPVLVEAARAAELLVLGDRGYGGFSGLLLGSVVEHCVRRAACSVVVVRGHR